MPPCVVDMSNAADVAHVTALREESIADMRQRIVSGQASGCEALVLNAMLAMGEWCLQQKTDFDKTSHPKALNALKQSYAEVFSRMVNNKFSAFPPMVAHLALMFIKMRARSFGCLDVVSVSQMFVCVSDADGATNTHTHDLMSVVLMEPLTTNERLSWAMQALLQDNCREDESRRRNCAMCQPCRHLPWAQAKLARFQQLERRMRLTWPEGISWDARHINVCVQTLCRLARQLPGPDGHEALARAESFMQLRPQVTKDEAVLSVLDRLHVELSLTRIELALRASLFEAAPLPNNLVDSATKTLLATWDGPPPHLMLQALLHIASPEDYDQVQQHLAHDAALDGVLVHHLAHAESMLVMYRVMVSNLHDVETPTDEDMAQMTQLAVAGGSRFKAAVQVHKQLPEYSRRCVVGPDIRLELLHLESLMLQAVNDHNRPTLAATALTYVTNLGEALSRLVLEPCWMSDVFGASIDLALIATRCSVIMSYLQKVFADCNSMMLIIDVIAAHCQRMFTMCGYATFNAATASRKLRTIVCSLISV
jgi:hypothetical protein